MDFQVLKFSKLLPVPSTDCSRAASEASSPLPGCLIQGNRLGAACTWILKADCPAAPALVASVRFRSKPSQPHSQGCSASSTGSFPQPTATEQGSGSVYFTDRPMAQMYTSIKPSCDPVHPSCPILALPKESKRPVRQPCTQESFLLKPEHCAVLPWAEDGAMHAPQCLPNRQNSPMVAKAMSLRVLLQPGCSSQVPALAVWFKATQYQTQ